jgi:hypothetical protein
MIDEVPERRLAFIHRVIMRDKEYPKEFAILVTDTRTIFLRQNKTRRSFVLRGEMRYGTALVTDVVPKSLDDDYRQISLESLSADSRNLSVPHDAVISLAMKKEQEKFRLRDFFIWLTMKRQGEIFQVYNFEMIYRQSQGRETTIKFYMVPLGAYFKPRRLVKSRETILGEYATDALEVFQRVLPAETISS